VSGEGRRTDDGVFARSGVWETEIVENAEAFAKACGATLRKRLIGKVDLRETRHVAHAEDVVQDTLVTGCVATTNVSKIGEWREVVNADGSTMKVNARWDGDVWVEVDDHAFMETRRWMERSSMIVARTVTTSTGELVTMRQFFRRFTKTADAVQRALGRASPTTPLLPQISEIKVESDKASDSGSGFFNEAVDFGSKMFSGFGFGGAAPTTTTTATTAATGPISPEDVKKTFKLPASTEYVSSFECALLTPTSSAVAQSTRGDKGTLHVLKYALAFVSADKNGSVKWFAEAISIQELTVEGTTTIALQTADGASIKLNMIKKRDDAFDTVIGMLESMPSSDEPTEAMDARPCGPPLRFGYEQESYVFVHIIDVSVEGEASTMPGTPVTKVMLGGTTKVVPSFSPTPTGFGGICANVGQTLAFSTTALNEFDGEHLAILVTDSKGEAIGEAMLPLASLPRDEEGRAYVRATPFVVNMSVPQLKVTTNSTGMRAKPVSKNAARGIGSLNISAWIGSTSEAIGLGLVSDEVDGTVSTKATVRVTPATCSITIVAQSVKGLQPFENEGVRCVIAYGSQQAETSAAKFSADETKFSFSEVTFNAEQPCAGSIRAEIITEKSGILLGSAELNVANLPQRRKDRNGKFGKAPRGKYHALSKKNDDGNVIEAGSLFLEAYVDPATTLPISQKPVLGELSVKVLQMKGLPKSCAPALIANVGDAWALLPGFGGGGPAGWKRELRAAIRDAADICTIGIFNRNAGGALLGKVRFSPLSLPEHNRAIICTVPLTTRDVFGVGDDNGEIMVRLQFKQTVSNAALMLHYFTPALPLHAYRNGDMDELSRDLDMLKYEKLITGADALPEPLVRAMLDVNETDPSISTTRRTKAGAMRLAAVLESFGDVLQPLTQAVTWEKPLYTGVLHVSIFLCLWFPRLAFAGYFAFIAWHVSMKDTPRTFTVLGENKSKHAGTVDVSRAPPGSTLSPLSSLVRETMGIKPKASASTDSYDAVIQVAFWMQAQIDYVRERVEKCSAILTWEEENVSQQYQYGLIGVALMFVFIPFRFVAAAALFLSLRHPWAKKPPVPPYKIALSRALASPA